VQALFGGFRRLGLDLSGVTGPRDTEGYVGRGVLFGLGVGDRIIAG